MANKKIIIWAIVIIGIVGLMIGLAYLGTKQNTIVEAKLTVPVSDDDISVGDKDAKVVLVEYGDFQCPACAQYVPIVERLRSEYADSMLFVFRHYPIRRIHPNAQLAAQSAQAASMQGKFLEYHDMLYEKQNDWSGVSNASDIFRQYAMSLNLDLVRFDADQKSEATLKKIQSDIDGGDESGVQGTPTFFLNGERVEPQGNYERFKQLIEAELN